MTAAPLRGVVAALVALAVTATGCSSGGDTQTTGSTITVESSTTSLEPTIEEPLSTTSTTIAATTTSSTTTTNPLGECDQTPGGRHLVDVRPDDPDGGLNLRTAAGADSDIVIPLPAGTEVAASGECVDVVDSGEWWSVAAVTDDSVRGWVAAAFLVPHTIGECEAGFAPLETLGDLSLTLADMDGDGLDDRVYIGNDASENTARLAVEFGAGGVAQGELRVTVAGGVPAAFRPIGAHHDIVMYRDVFGGGASTSRFVFAEVDGCEVRDFGSIEAGASVGWGALGYCLEPTPLGMRLWEWNAVGETAEEGLANRVDEPLHYFDGEFVPGTGELEGRECLETTEPRSFRLAAAFVDTRGVGLQAPTLEELVAAVVAVLGADEDSTIAPVGEPVGIDAQGGFATYDIIGLKDDSIGGYRMRLEFGTVLTDGRLSGVRADRVILAPFCTRGVTEDGFCT